MNRPPDFALRRMRPALGTLVELRANGVSGQAVSDSFAALAAVEAALSFFRDGSDVDRLNRAAKGDCVRLGGHACEVLRLAMAVERESHGAFNANLGACLIRRGVRPARYEERGVDMCCAYEGLAWVDETSVRLERRVCLDLGGIAKGYAVDCALRVLREAGATGAVVNAGGDLAVFGPQALPVSVRATENWQGTAQVLQVKDAALATSARYAEAGPFHGERGMGILDRQGDWAATTPISLSVQAPTCALADALTKVLFAGGPTLLPVLDYFGARLLACSDKEFIRDES